MAASDRNRKRKEKPRSTENSRKSHGPQKQSTQHPTAPNFQRQNWRAVAPWRGFGALTASACAQLIAGVPHLQYIRAEHGIIYRRCRTAYRDGGVLFRALSPSIWIPSFTRFWHRWSRAQGSFAEFIGSSFSTTPGWSSAIECSPCAREMASATRDNVQKLRQSAGKIVPEG